jgi:plastocyanin
MHEPMRQFGSQPFNALGVLSNSLCRFEQAAAYHTEALHVWRERGDRAGMAQALCDSGWQQFDQMHQAQLPALVSRRDSFDRAELRTKVGETVALRLENSDTERHYFDIDEFDVHVPISTGTPALALFTPSAPGSYTFYCHVPGHTEAGMVGTLIVEP